VRLLLDTCVLLWVADEPGRLSSAAREAIEDGTNECLLSSASAWEISIKHALGRLTLPDVPDRFVPEARRRHAIQSLAISEEVALQVAKIPALHRDPFDRLLVAQATLLGLVLVSPDPVFSRYAVRTLW